MDFASQIVEPTLQDLFSRWEDKSVGGCVPTRADFDALSLPPGVLPFVFILERHGERFFCRLAGTGIRGMLGFEASQRYMDELIPEAQQVRGELFGRVLDEQTPAYFRGALVLRGEAGPMAGCLLLPVSTQGGAANQLFCAFAASGDVAPLQHGWIRSLDRVRSVSWAA